jgi:adenosylhomocysteine nucleosidase
MEAECRSLTSKRVPEGGYLAMDQDCLVGFSGAGPAAAARNAALLAEAGITALISWGCAAALDPPLKPGDLVLPAHIIGADGAILNTHAAWRERLAAQLAPHMPVYDGAILESRRIVGQAEEKRELFARTRAIALDMESAAAARAALAHNLPFLAIRSIVDPADINIPPSIEAAFDEKGILHVPKMLGRALLRPIDFAGIIRLGKHFDAAMATLKTVAALSHANQFAIT